VALTEESYAEVARVHPGDAALIAGLLARDEAIFDQLVRAWTPALVRVAAFHVGSWTAAEDIAQETWIAVVKQIGTFEGRSSLRTWVLSICANQARRLAAAERRTNPIGLPGQDADTVDSRRFERADQERPGYWTSAGQPTGWGPESAVLNAETRATLKQALLALPARQADVVALRDIHQLEIAEIADLVGINEGNVRVILHRARAALRERLATQLGEGASA
jgi:RNA polymerase sigma-70 factor (ECF subfamily)